MTPEQAADEQVAFHKRFPLPESGTLLELHSRGERYDGWKARAEIAIAERAELQAEIERLRETIREYCDDDEASSGFGSGCYTKHKIKEIRKRHGIGVESEGA